MTSVAAVTVAAAPDVGRTGTLTIEDDAVDEGGHSCGPHRRSVGQQPPPSVAGHDWYPEEQVRGATIVEASGAEVVGGVDVVRDEDVVTVDDSKLDVDVGVGVVVGVVLVDEGVTVGCITTVVVEMSTPVHR